MFCWPSTGVQILDLTPGERLCMRHSLYPTNQMTFRNCTNVLLQDITVESSPGECCAIYPRCRDFTFRRFAVRLPAGSKRIYASNADGIHITGLGGKLVIEDSIFENLGDDALNVHTTGAVITGVDGNHLSCTLGDGWALLACLWRLTGRRPAMWSLSMGRMTSGRRVPSEYPVMKSIAWILRM